MDMDIDVGWCLSCSKKTPDPKRPYCSDACRQQDSASQTPALEPVGITSPVPPSFIIPASPPHSGNPTPRASNTPSEAAGPATGLELSGVAISMSASTSTPPAVPPPRPSGHRPSLSTLTALGGYQPASSSNVILIHSAGKQPRDRRAFSFPEQQPQPQPHSAHPQPQQASPIEGSSAYSSKCNSITIMPRFARKTNSVASNSGVRPSLGLGRPGRLSMGFEKLSLSTGGANTPNIPESAVWSASESENEQAVASGPAPVSDPLATVPAPGTDRSSPIKKSQPLPSTSAGMRPTPLDTLQIQLGVTTSRSTSLTSQLPTARPHLGDPRKSSVGGHGHSQSPVATLIATSASSRSREDIISWARAVGGRPRANPIEDGEEEAEGDDESVSGSASGSGSDHRGRSRTRRPSALTNSLTPNQGSVSKFDDVDAAGAPGTTPRGPRSIGSFSSANVRRPIVQPLTSATIAATHALLAATSSTSATLPSTEARLTSPKGPAAPAPAEVSLVDVVVGAQAQSQSGHSTNYDIDEPSLPSIINGGITPTLSTISFSEAHDPSSATDYDQADVTPDDQSATMSSGFARIVKQQLHFRARSQSHPAQVGEIPPPSSMWSDNSQYPQSPAMRKYKRSSIAVVGGASASAFSRLETPKSPKSPQQESRSPLPLRPITSTASAIWSLSSYLRSLTPFSAPFSLSSTLAPSTAPEVAVATNAPPSPLTEDMSKGAGPVDQNRTRPMPASSRVNSPGRDTENVDEYDDQDEENDDALGLGLGLGLGLVASGSGGRTVVRSLPMDIVVPPGREQVVEEKKREAMERHAQAHIHARKSRSRSRSRSRTRIEPSRSPSVESKRPASPHQPAQFLSTEAAAGQGQGQQRPTKGHKRQYSYDADASEVEGDPHSGGRRASEGKASVTEDRGRRGSSNDDDDDERGRRGRSRRGKVVTVSTVTPLEPIHPIVTSPTAVASGFAGDDPAYRQPTDQFQASAHAGLGGGLGLDLQVTAYASESISPKTTQVPAVEEEGRGREVDGEERRGRRRDRKGESRDRSWSVGRGREIERRGSRPRVTA